jgi:hypothetical protein
MSYEKFLLTAVFGPYGVKDEWGEDLGCQMELMNNQITREQGVHSPRQAYWSFSLYLMAKNVSVETAVLDFPSWDDFTRELKKGYTHVGISFIVPNVLKAKRMAQYIRKNHPETKIILGGYGTIIPDLNQIVPYDELCKGEGVRWLREYFGDDPNAPLKHPAIMGPAYEYIYGYKGKPKGAVLLPGLGCENGCTFCITSHKFSKCYVPLLKTGKDVYEVCERSEKELDSTGFSVMDENFCKQPDRARELLEQMEKNKKPYVFDFFSSAETVKALGVDFMVRLGVHLLWIGVESKSNSHEKTKGIDFAEMFKELQDAGIVVQASSILFQDHHDEKTIHEDIDWVIGLNSNLVQFMNYTPFPTTSLYQKMENENRLKNVHYRHQHGQGELVFDHPHFKDPKDHINILRNAFLKKYMTDGPGVLNMALTAINGYEKAKNDYKDRLEKGLSWDPETLSYKKTDKDPRDEFMELRIRKLEKIAINIRVVLWAAWVFAPNKEARAKARFAMERFEKVLGKQSFADRLKAVALISTGTFEWARLGVNKLLGHETIVRQPPSKTEVFPYDISIKKAKPVKRVVA